MIRIFRHYIPKPLFFLGTVEAVILLLSMYMGVLLRLVGTDDSIEILAGGSLWPRAVVFALVMIAVMTAMGLYQRDLREGMRSVVLRVGLSFVVGLLAMTMLFYGLPDLFLGRGAFGLALVSAFLGIVVTRAVFYHVTDQEQFKQRVMVLGGGRMARQIENLKRKSDWRGMTLVGFVPMGEGSPEVNPDKLLNGKMSLPDLAQQHRIDQIVVAVDDRRKTLPVDDILECKLKGIEVIDHVRFFERRTGRITLESLHPSSVIFSDGFSRAMIKCYSKRTFDIVVSLLILLVTMPVLLLTMLAIFIEGKGREPIFYRQVRVGRNGNHFDVLKFRSMCVNAEADGVARWACRNDDRVTAVGAFIRKTRIDELPQLFNVLKGEMSFVGPRPERPQFVEELQAKLPYYSMRHRVNPGITGWAQVCYPYGASEDDARQKLQYDLYYIKNYSIFLDMMILFQTAQVILWGKGAR